VDHQEQLIVGYRYIGNAVYPDGGKVQKSSGTVAAEQHGSDSLSVVSITVILSGFWVLSPTW
jgi:hypothetical protein